MSMTFTVDVMKDSHLINLTPKFMHPLVGRLVSSISSVRRNTPGRSSHTVFKCRRSTVPIGQISLTTFGACLSDWNIDSLPCRPLLRDDVHSDSTESSSKATPDLYFVFLASSLASDHLP